MQEKRKNFAELTNDELLAMHEVFYKAFDEAEDGSRYEEILNDLIQYTENEMTARKPMFVWDDSGWHV